MSAFLGSTSGLTRQRLRSRRYERLSRDLYVLRGAAEDLRARTEAALLVLPDATPCRLTAALLQRLPVDDDGRLHLARGETAPRSRRADVVVHRTPVDRDELLDLDGLAVTDGPRTWVDLAPALADEALAAVGDVVLRRYGRPALQAAVERRHGRPGVVRARRILPLLDAGADSPAETRARLRLHAAGFRELRHGVVVRDAAGQWLAAPDLADERARVAVQHDGLVHLLGSAEQRRSDLERDELARQVDWQVVVATARDDRHPHLLIGRLVDAYRRAAVLHGRGVLPPHLR
jgi:hypothetical protein